MPDKTYLKDAAVAIDQTLPDNHAFILLTMPLGTGGRLAYVSSLERADAIRAMKEFLFRVGEHEDWMTHIK